MPDGGDLRPGTLSMHSNGCGNPTCKCKADPPRKHGPDHQVSFTRKGKGSTTFVKEEDLPAVGQQLQNCGRKKARVDRWIELSMEPSLERSNLRLARRKP